MALGVSFEADISYQQRTLEPSIASQNGTAWESLFHIYQLSSCVGGALRLGKEGHLR